MAAIRTADVTWRGDLLTGSGSIDYVGSGALARMAVTWGSRTEASDGRTSPEELLAAAHASCFAMAFSSRLAKAGHPATSLNVRATVTFDKGDAGWFIASSALTVMGIVPGMAAAEFEALAADAKDNCPISQALKGNVALSVSASLAG
jgi:osmotically inducible protein OsmC